MNQATKQTPQQQYKAAQPKIVDFMQGRVPPQALDLEMAVLCGAIISKPGLDDLMSAVKSPEVFFDERNQLLFSAMQGLYDQSKPVDVLTLSQALKAMGKLEAAGGDFYILTVYQAFSSGAHSEYHAYILLQYYMKREVITQGMQFVAKAYNDDQDALELVEQWAAAQDNIAQVAFQGKRDKSFEQELAGVRAKVRFLTDKDPGQISGVSTGFANADRFTGGWQPGDLIIFAADTGMGKTAAALECALANIKVGVPVGIVSAEMSAYQCTARLVSQDTNFHLRQITKTGFEKEQYFGSLDTAIARMAKYPLYIDDTGHPDISHVKSKIRLWVRKHGVKMVIVDYLQLIGDASIKGLREQEVASVSRQLKGLAKELGIPVILLSQVSKEVGKQSDKRPRIGDIRESAAPAHDADAVIFFVRMEYYYGDNWKNFIDADVLAAGGDTEMIFAKYRGGAPNTVIPLKWIGDKTKYMDPAFYHPYEEVEDMSVPDGFKHKPLPLPTAEQAFGPPYSIEDKSTNDKPGDVPF